MVTAKLPVYYRSLYSMLGIHKYSVGDTDESEEDQENDSECSGNDNMKFTREDTNTEDENKDEDEKDASEEDQEIDNEDVDDNDTYNVEVEKEKKAEDSLVNQVTEPTVHGALLDTPAKPSLLSLLKVTDFRLPPNEVTKQTNQLINSLKSERTESDINKEESVISMDLWDFAGQHLYYASHPVFFSSRAVYILVYNLSKALNDKAEPCFRQGYTDVALENPNGETNVENLLSWLATVHNISQMKETTVNDSAQRKRSYLRPPVLIVGTHADKPSGNIPSTKLQIQKRLAGKEYEKHVVRPFFSIDNTASSHDREGCHPVKAQPAEREGDIDNIQALQNRIMEIWKEEPYMGEMIPVRWINFEKVLSALVAKNIHCADVNELQMVAKDVCFIEDKKEFDTMLQFYHDLGMIVKHRGTVVLKAQWLIDLFRQLITIPPFEKADPIVCTHWKELGDTGVLSMELVDHVFSKFLQQGVNREDILHMMERFGLIAKFALTPTEEKYFVPAQLSAPPDAIHAVRPSKSDPCTLYINFVGGFVPHGLFTQLVSRSIRWCSLTGSSQPPTLYQNGAWLIIGEHIIHSLYLICKKRFIKVILKQMDESQQVSEQKPTEVATKVRKFVEDALQDLSRDLPYLRGMQYHFSVECPYCEREIKECEHHRQLSCKHEDCLHLLQIKQGKAVICTKTVYDKTFRVPGQEKWFPQVLPKDHFSYEQPGIHPYTDASVEEMEGTAATKRRLPVSSVQDSKRRKVINDTGAFADEIPGSTSQKRTPLFSDPEGSTKRSKLMGDRAAERIFLGLQKMQDDTIKIISKAYLSEELKKITLNKGFVISDNQGEGNCMFYALSEQLDLVKRIHISHEELRERLVQYLDQSPTLSDGTELFNFVHGCPSWTDYLRKMSADGTWGDHLILHAAANCFETYIHVISSLSNDITISPTCDVDRSEQLVLGHVHEHHYVSLKPLPVKEGKPSNEELEYLSLKIGDTWINLGRRFFEKGRLDGFHKDNEKLSEKAYAMLTEWSESRGSDATYLVLYQALCHKCVNRRDLAEEICLRG